MYGNEKVKATLDQCIFFARPAVLVKLFDHACATMCLTRWG